MGRRPRKGYVKKIREWNAATAWWFGCLLGDGNVYRNDNNGDYKTSIAGAESTVRRWLAVVDPSRGPLKIKGANAVQGVLNSRELVEYITERWGICGPKSHDLPWPEDLPADLFVHFARGLWDTDGSLYVECRPQGKGYDSPCAVYASKDRSFCERLRDALCEAFGTPCVAVVEHRKGRHVYHTISYGGASAMLVAEGLYSGAPAHLVNDDRLEAFAEMREAASVASADCACGRPATREGVCQACWWAKRRAQGKIKTGPGTECSTEGCSKPVVARKMCRACYSRERRRAQRKAS